MKQADALSFEQALELMPDEFHPYAVINSRSKQVESGVDKRIVSFHQSSKLKSGGWKTSHNEEELFEDVDFILFALGFEGILLLPSELILVFNDENYNSRYSGNRIPIHIFKDNVDGKTEYVWQGKDDNRLYVTEYFYPNIFDMKQEIETENMEIKVYVIKDRALIDFIEEDDVDGFAKYLADEETYTFDEPIQFDTEKEALAFCAGIGYGVDERMPVERLPLRSFEEYDSPFIKEVKKYL